MTAEPTYLKGKTLSYEAIQGASFEKALRSAFEVSVVEGLPVEFMFNDTKVAICAEDVFDEILTDASNHFGVEPESRQGYREEV